MTGRDCETQKSCFIVSFCGLRPDCSRRDSEHVDVFVRRETTAVSLDLASALCWWHVKVCTLGESQTVKITSFFLLYRIQIIYCDPESRLHVRNSSTSGSYFGFELV